jgi:HlyD family secretion protein
MARQVAGIPPKRAVRLSEGPRWWIRMANLCLAFGFVPGLVVVLLVLLTACTPREQKELKPGEKAIILTATVLPEQEADVTSPITAIADKVLADPGKKVREGDVLVRLDATPLQAEVDREEATLATARANLAEAQASIAASEAQIAEAQAEAEGLRQELRRQEALAALPPSSPDFEQAGIVLDNAKARLERVYALFARRIASQPEVESAENDYAEARRRFETAREALERGAALGDSDVKIAEARYRGAQAKVAGLKAAPRRAQIETAQAIVRHAEADVAKAQYNLGQTVLKAPLAGIVTEVMVQPGVKVYEGRPLLHVADIARVRVAANLSPGLLPYVHIGQKAQVTVNTVPPTSVAATVDRIQPVADPKTQSLGLTLFLPNPDLKFQPGYTARVEIPVEGSSSKKPAGKEGGA